MIEIMAKNVQKLLEHENNGENRENKLKRAKQLLLIQ